MKKKLLIWIASFMMLMPAYAQKFEDVLLSVEQNNATLRALRDGVEAEKLDNHTGLTLDDPEVEYSHFWGSPSAIGLRNDFSVSQSFDFATLFGMKRKMARSKDELADFNYEEQRLQVLLETSQLLVGMVYLNKCLAHHERQWKDVQQVVSHSKTAYEAGRINVLEYRRAQQTEAELASTICDEQMQLEECQSRLRLLNGGQTVTFNDTIYSMPQSMSRGMQIVVREREDAEQRVAESGVRLAKSSSIPQLKVAYVSELTTDEKFRGFTVGMSVPLWSNKNNVKRAKAQLQASKSERDEALQRLQSEYEALKQRSERLRKYTQVLWEGVSTLSSATVLHDAFLRGDISAFDYYVELTSDYERVHKALQTERDYQLTLATLAWY